MHKNGSKGMEKIKNILKSHQELKDRAAKNEINKKTDEIRQEINKQRNSGGLVRELRSEQVQAILESRGKENIQENIYELMIFLRDIENNYDFYSNSQENIDNDILDMYSKYENTKKVGLGKRVGLMGRLGARLKSATKDIFQIRPDVDEVNNFARMIRKTRELNLVDRKTGNGDLANQNQGRMRDLIRLCEGQFSLLTEHVRNPDSNKESELKGKEIEALKLFDEMYETFADAKYRSNKGKKEAENVLRSGDIPLETTQKIKESAFETLFDDTYEMKSFAEEAAREVYREALSDLEKEIEAFPKSRKDDARLTGMEKRYAEIKSILKEVGDDDDDKHLHIIALKLQNLVIKHIDKDKYAELSENFATYDQMLADPKVSAAEKKGHVEELITALKKHKAHKGNTMVQNKVLGDTIEKYETISKNIK